MAKFVNEDGGFEAGFEQNLTESVRDYAKGFKTLEDALKSGLEGRREFRDRVKIPAEPTERKKFIQEHFGKDLEAEAAAKKKGDDEAAAKLQTEQRQAAQAAAQTQAAASEKLLKEKHGANFDKDLELVRRAFRSDHVPEWIKAGVAQAAGVAPDQLTDDHIKMVAKTDPAVFETLLKIGTLTQDGRTEHGDGHSSRTEEKYPSYPYSPEVYAGEPDTNPEKRWMIARGAIFQNGKYTGGLGGIARQP